MVALQKICLPESNVTHFRAHEAEQHNKACMHVPAAEAHAKACSVAAAAAADAHFISYSGMPADAQRPWLVSRLLQALMLLLQGDLPGHAVGPFSEGAADLGGELWEAALQKPCTGHCR